MQDFNNKKFRNRFTQTMYVDKYLALLGSQKMNDMDEMGIDVTPRDENDVFVPIDKNTPANLEEVQNSIQEAYGLKVC